MGKGRRLRLRIRAGRLPANGYRSHHPLQAAKEAAQALGPGRWLHEEARGPGPPQLGGALLVRTKLREGRLEVDFSPKRLLLRFEQLRLPEGVAFTTNRDLFQGPYPRKIGRPAIHLGWEVQGGEKADEEAVRAFLQAPENVADLRRLDLLPDGRRLELTLERGAESQGLRGSGAGEAGAAPSSG